MCECVHVRVVCVCAPVCDNNSEREYTDNWLWYPNKFEKKGKKIVTMIEILKMKYKLPLQLWANRVSL